MFYFHCIVIHSGLITWLFNGSSTQLGARYEHCKRLESSDPKNGDGVITDVNIQPISSKAGGNFISAGVLFSL
jgi:hypothetical protein